MVFMLYDITLFQNLLLLFFLSYMINVVTTPSDVTYVTV